MRLTGVFRTASALTGFQVGWQPTRLLGTCRLPDLETRCTEMVVRILLSDSIHLIPVTLNDFFSWPGDRNSTSVTLGKKKKNNFQSLMEHLSPVSWNIWSHWQIGHNYVVFGLCGKNDRTQNVNVDEVWLRRGGRGLEYDHSGPTEGEGWQEFPFVKTVFKSWSSFCSQCHFQTLDFKCFLCSNCGACRVSFHWVWVKNTCNLNMVDLLSPSQTKEICLHPMI